MFEVDKDSIRELTPSEITSVSGGLMIGDKTSLTTTTLTTVTTGSSPVCTSTTTTTTTTTTSTPCPTTITHEGGETQ